MMSKLAVGGWRQRGLLLLEAAVLLYFAIGKYEYDPRVALGPVSLNLVLQVVVAAALAVVLWRRLPIGMGRSRAFQLLGATTLLLWLGLLHSDNTAYRSVKPLGYAAVVLPCCILLLPRLRAAAAARRLLVLWAGLGTAMMLAGVALQASGHGPARLAILGGGANVYARMVASALLVLVGLGVARGRTARLLLLLALPGFATALLFAGSKAVLLAFGAALAGWAWFVGRRRTLVGAALCTTVFALAPFWTPWAVGHVDRTRGVERLVMPPDLQDPKGSYGARQRYTTQSLQLLATHGWLGVGTGDWGPAVGRPTGRQYPHNLFLELWCELGLPGLAAGVLLVAWFVGLVRRCRRAAGDPRLAATLAALFAFWILNAQLSGDLLDNRNLWWVLLLLEAVALQPAAGAARLAVAHRAPQPAAIRSLQAERMATP